MPRHSSNIGIHAELGRFPIQVNVHQAMIKYWFRLISLPGDRLASHCYWTIFNNNTENDPWLNTIKNILNLSGQSHNIWNNQKLLGTQSRSTLRMHEKGITAALINVSAQNSALKMSEETKLTLLNNTKHKNTLSLYLNSIPCRKQRSLFSKLRSGTLD